MKHADEPAVAAMVAGELPGNSHAEAGLAAVVMLPPLLRCCRSKAATGSGTSSQSAPSLSRVAPPAQEVSVARRAAIVLACWP